MMVLQRTYVLVLFFVVFGRLAPETFMVTTSCNGTVLCANDQPSATIKFLSDQTVVNTVCVPAAVLCAWNCILDSRCVGYNYWWTFRHCEIYDAMPTNLTARNGCSYFQVCAVFSLNFKARFLYLAFYH